MTELLVATTNQGKIREVLSIMDGPILDGTSPRVLTLADLNRPIPDPEETGRTFAENARLKARYYADETGLTTVAEDSGLAIDALGGRPGIHSARYPGETYPDKFRNLYAELAAHRRPWTARYVCALALVQGPGSRVQGSNLTHPFTHSPTHPLLFECEGVVEGEVWPEPRGPHGFGYDPIFYFPEYGATFGEVTDEKKLAVAHRGRAFRQLRDFLRMSPGSLRQ